MAKHYVVTTDGEITYFRASASKAYRTATPVGPRGASFSSSISGPLRVFEISSKEFLALIKAKAERFAAKGRDVRHSGAGDNWVANAVAREVWDKLEING